MTGETSHENHSTASHQIPISPQSSILLPILPSYHLAMKLFSFLAFLTLVGVTLAQTNCYNL